MNICVFCSSSNAVNKIYFNAAEELGELIGKNSHQLIYGGANVGLMHQLAVTAKKNGGKVSGVIPQKIADRNLASKDIDELIVTQTMDQRKTLLHQKSDAFIAMPGGFGTLEEILEVITLKQLDYHQKPIVFININGFFNDLFAQFEKSYTETFARENYRKLYFITTSCEKAMTYIENYQHEELDTKWFNVPHK